MMACNINCSVAVAIASLSSLGQDSNLLWCKYVSGPGGDAYAVAICVRLCKMLYVNRLLHSLTVLKAHRHP